MTRMSVGALCVFAICLSTSSCTKLEPIGGTVGQLSFEPAKFTDAIPDDYGTLVGTTQATVSPDWVALWFQKPDRTITGVFVNVRTGRIYPKTLSIPRK